jgi:hypothetical protein
MQQSHMSGETRPRYGINCLILLLIRIILHGEAENIVLPPPFPTALSAQLSCARCKHEASASSRSTAKRPPKREENPAQPLESRPVILAGIERVRLVSVARDPPCSARDPFAMPLQHGKLCLPRM